LQASDGLAPGGQLAPGGVPAVAEEFTVIGEPFGQLVQGAELETGGQLEQ
jgi:hypothetical protein